MISSNEQQNETIKKIEYYRYSFVDLFLHQDEFIITETEEDTKKHESYILRNSINLLKTLKKLPAPIYIEGYNANTPFQKAVDFFNNIKQITSIPMKQLFDVDCDFSNLTQKELQILADQSYNCRLQEKAKYSLKNQPEKQTKMVHISQEQVDKIASLSFQQLFAQQDDFNIEEQNFYEITKGSANLSKFNLNYHFLRAIKNLSFTSPPLSNPSQKSFQEAIAFYTELQNTIKSINPKLLCTQDIKSVLQNNKLTQDELQFISKCFSQADSNLTEEQLKILTNYRNVITLELYQFIDKFDFITENTIPPDSFCNIINRIKALKKLPYNNFYIEENQAKNINFILYLDEKTEKTKEIIKSVLSNNFQTLIPSLPTKDIQAVADYNDLDKHNIIQTAKKELQLRQQNILTQEQIKAIKESNDIFNTYLNLDKFDFITENTITTKEDVENIKEIINFIKALKNLPHDTLSPYKESVLHFISLIEQNITNPKQFIKNIEQCHNFEPVFKTLLPKELEFLASSKLDYHGFIQIKAKEFLKPLTTEQRQTLTQPNYYSTYLNLDKFDFITERTTTIEDNKQIEEKVNTIKAFKKMPYDKENVNETVINFILYIEQNTEEPKKIIQIIKDYSQQPTTTSEQISKLSEKDLNFIINGDSTVFCFTPLKDIAKEALSYKKNQLTPEQTQQLNNILSVYGFHSNLTNFHFITENTLNYLHSINIIKALKNYPYHENLLNEIQKNYIKIIKHLENEAEHPSRIIRFLSENLLNNTTTEQEPAANLLIQNLSPQDLNAILNIPVKYELESLLISKIQEFQKNQLPNHKIKTIINSNYLELFSLQNDFNITKDTTYTTNSQINTDTQEFIIGFNFLKALKDLPYETIDNPVFQEAVAFYTEIQNKIKSKSPLEVIHQSDIKGLTTDELTFLANQTYYPELRTRAKEQLKAPELLTPEQLKAVDKIYSISISIFTVYLNLDKFDFIGAETTSYTESSAIKINTIKAFKKLPYDKTKVNMPCINFILSVEQNTDNPKQIIDYIDKNSTDFQPLFKQLSKKDLNFLANLEQNFEKLFPLISKQAKEFLTAEQEEQLTLALNLETLELYKIIDRFDFINEYSTTPTTVKTLDIPAYENTINRIKALKKLPYNKHKLNTFNIPFLDFILYLEEHTENPKEICNSISSDSWLQHLKEQEIKAIADYKPCDSITINSIINKAQNFLKNKEFEQIKNKSFSDLFINQDNYNLDEIPHNDSNDQQINFLKAIKGYPYYTSDSAIINKISFFTTLQNNIKSIDPKKLHNAVWNESEENTLNLLKKLTTQELNTIEQITIEKNTYTKSKYYSLIQTIRQENLTTEQLNLLSKHYNYTLSLYLDLDDYKFVTEYTPTYQNNKHLVNRIKALKNLPYDKDNITEHNIIYTDFILHLEKHAEKPKEIIKLFLNDFNISDLSQKDLEIVLDYEKIHQLEFIVINKIKSFLKNQLPPTQIQEIHEKSFSELFTDQDNYNITEETTIPADPSISLLLGFIFLRAIKNLPISKELSNNKTLNYEILNKAITYFTTLQNNIKSIDPKTLYKEDTNKENTLNLLRQLTTQEFNILEKETRHYNTDLPTCIQIIKEETINKLNNHNFFQIIAHYKDFDPNQQINTNNEEIKSKLSLIQSLHNKQQPTTQEQLNYINFFNATNLPTDFYDHLDFHTLAPEQLITIIQQIENEQTKDIINKAKIHFLNTQNFGQIYLNRKLFKDFPQNNQFPFLDFINNNFQNTNSNHILAFFKLIHENIENPNELIDKLYNKKDFNISYLTQNELQILAKQNLNINPILIRQAKQLVNTITIPINPYYLYLHLDDFDLITENTIETNENIKIIKSLKNPNNDDFLSYLIKNTTNTKQIVELLLKLTDENQNPQNEEEIKLLSNLPEKDIQTLSNCPHKPNHQKIKDFLLYTQRYLYNNNTLKLQSVRHIFIYQDYYNLNLIKDDDSLNILKAFKNLPYKELQNKEKQTQLEFFLHLPYNKDFIKDFSNDNENLYNTLQNASDEQLKYLINQDIYNSLKQSAKTVLQLKQLESLNEFQLIDQINNYPTTIPPKFKLSTQQQNNLNFLIAIHNNNTTNLSQKQINILNFINNTKHSITPTIFNNLNSIPLSTEQYLLIAKQDLNDDTETLINTAIQKFANQAQIPELFLNRHIFKKPFPTPTTTKAETTINEFCFNIKSNKPSFTKIFNTFNSFENPDLFVNSYFYNNLNLDHLPIKDLQIIANNSDSIFSTQTRQQAQDLINNKQEQSNNNNTPIFLGLLAAASIISAISHKKTTPTTKKRIKQQQTPQTEEDDETTTSTSNKKHHNK